MISLKIASVIVTTVVVLSPAAFAQTMTLDEALAQAAKWQSDTSRKPLQTIFDATLKAAPAQKREIEQKFIAFLKSDATLAGKDFICKQLSLMGSEASVPALSAMFADSKTAEMGRYALERIPGAAVDRALRDALAKTSGKTRIGVINTLGERHDSGAVTALGPIALGAQQAEATAALYALAQIANPAAITILDQAQSKTSGSVRNNAAEAYLQAANRLSAGGNASSALPIYRKLYAATDPGTVRAAALRGLAAAGGAQSTPVLMEAVRGSDLRLQAIAVNSLIPASANQLVAEMPKLSEAAQVRILGLLSERGDVSGLPAFTVALKSSSKPVRLAALQGIGPIANASSVTPLAAIAAGDDTAEQTAARASLGQIRGKDVDQAIGQAIPGAPVKVRRELVRAAGERGATVAAPAVLARVREEDTDLRRESIKALREIGTASEIEGLTAVVVQPVHADDRTEAVRSLAAVLRRSDAARVKDVLGAYSRANDLEVRTALMQVMGQSGNPEALAPLRAALKDSNADVKRVAILALGEWPDVTPVPDLFEAARTATLPAHQVLALRSALKLIAVPAPARPSVETVKYLASAMGLAKQAEEKRAILASIQRYPVKEALDVASAAVNDPDVGAEAKAAVTRLERTVRR